VVGSIDEFDVVLAFVVDRRSTTGRITDAGVVVWTRGIAGVPAFAIDDAGITATLRAAGVTTTGRVAWIAAAIGITGITAAGWITRVATTTFRIAGIATACRVARIETVCGWIARVVLCTLVIAVGVVVRAQWVAFKWTAEAVALVVVRAVWVLAPGTFADVVAFAAWICAGVWVALGTAWIATAPGITL